jgi:hypothetical protein
VFTLKNCLAAVLFVAVFESSGTAARADGIPLGIAISDTPTNGIEVTEVLPGGIAERCMPRLRPGARIITLNGLPVKSAADFKCVIESSVFVRFEFVDPTGNFRWARAWSAGHAPNDGKACCTIPALH